MAKSTLSQELLRGFLLLDLLANAAFLFFDFRGNSIAKILELENRPKLDFGAAIERSAFEPFHCFFHRTNLPQPKTGNDLFRLGTLPVNHGSSVTRECP